MRATPLALVAFLAIASLSPSWARAEELQARMKSMLPAGSSPAVISQDPLMRQIMFQQISQPNGGIKGYAAPRIGPPIELNLGDVQRPSAADKRAASQVSAGAASPLNVQTGLAPEPKAPPSKPRISRRASDQLKSLDKQGWSAEKKKDRAPEPAKKRKAPDAEIL